MPLPAPEARTPLHTRTTVFRGFRRHDQLWDIEGELLDIKAKVLPIPGEDAISPGEPLHGMAIRVTIDDQFVIHAINVTMDATPHRECPQAQASMQSMVGCTMGRGWRQAIEHNLGGICGCTHLRELLFNMATVAFQTLANELADDNSQHPPPFFGTCSTWDFNGPVVARLYPQFVGWQPGTKTAAKPLSNRCELVTAGLHS
ncbi:MAG: DUF2889 domain-containing protein [Rhodoferax sp.]|uniref:DUF2889 domain-containing protein n=1 Tax=Rhodoferax sp. TaxID=50421 RepID=UPI00260C59CE|nr:DUF2889 domain-containing protein [Rhodoferax sp.]MDD2879825.1 DUF2889 domain-containing protein [Rhodoferax sp.]